MYLNWINDRKLLGYTCLVDIKTGKQLVLITDSGVLFVTSIVLKGKHTIYIASTAIIILSSVRSAGAIGPHLPPPKQSIVKIMPTQNIHKLVKPSQLRINSNMNSKITMPDLSNSIKIKKKSDLKDCKWIESYISILRGGSNESNETFLDNKDEALIKSIINKVSDSSLDIQSINKLLKKLAETVVKLGSNTDLMRILSELERPLPKSSVFVEGLINPLPQHRNSNEIGKNGGNFDSNSICYNQGHINDMDMHRTVSENFQTNAIKKLAKASLKNTEFQKEYSVVKALLEAGVSPTKIGGGSTYVSSNMVLIKKPEGRYLVQVSDNNIDIVGISARCNTKRMRIFQDLMNKEYDVNLRGY